MLRYNFSTMNIFYVDSDPVIAAKSLHNKHIHKMALESCQLLITCFTEERLKSAPLTSKGTSWKHTHYNHPCAKWVRESRNNFEWLFHHAYELISQYKLRYNKNSSLRSILMWIHHEFYLNGKPENLHWKQVISTPPQCMPDKYKVINDPVQAYRNYYIGEKYHYFITNKERGRTKEYYNKWMDEKDIPQWFLSNFPLDLYNNFVHNK